MNNLFSTFFRLREEALKKWEYVITDVVMKYSDTNEWNTITHDFISNQESITKVRNRWWEVLIRDVNDKVYCALIEPTLAYSTLERDMGEARTDSDNPVLVKIRHLVNKPQRVGLGFFHIPCVVRLKRIDDLSGVIGDMLQEAFNMPSGFPVVVDTDGECRSIKGGRCREQSQLPNQVVKGRAQVMENVASNYAKREWDGNVLNPEDICHIIRIELFGDNTERFSVIPFTDNFIERLYVFRRPIELTSWPIEFVHMLILLMGTEIQEIFH